MFWNWLLKVFADLNYCTVTCHRLFLQHRRHLEPPRPCEYEIPFVVALQILSCVQLFASPWTAALQDSPSFTISRSLLKLMSIESVMLSSHLVLSRPLLLLPSIFPSIRVFSNESVLRIRWPKYRSFSFSTSSFNEHSGLISFRIDWLVFRSLLLAMATRGKHFFRPTLGNQSLRERKMGSWTVNLSAKCLRNTQGLVAHYFIFLSLHFPVKS